MNAAQTWPSADALNRILDATGRNFVPPKLDIGALRTDLHECRWDFLNKQFDTARYRASYKRASKAIIEHARALRQLLASSGNRLFDIHLSRAFDGANDTFLLLKELISVAKKIDEHGIASLPGAPKPHLVNLLVPIYENHFSRKAGRTRALDGADVGGPFARFAEAVSKEMGSPSIRLSRHTVDKAIAIRRRAGKNIGKSHFAGN